MTDTPHGYTRGDDGVLRIAPVGFGKGRSDPNEAVKQNDKFVCQEVVWRGYCMNNTCGKTAKHDPDRNGNPTRCGIHSQAAKDRRKAKSDAKMQERQDAMDARNHKARMKDEAVQIIRQIAEGHNDPRCLCADWVKREGEG